LEHGGNVSSDSGNAGDRMKHEDWIKEFHGRCVACNNATHSTRKNEVRCQRSKAWDHGLSSRPGGTKFYEPVHKLFGCVYWEPMESSRVDTDADMGIIKSEKP